MAPKVTETETSVSFSEKEMFMLASAWQCTTEQPKVDNAKLAKMCGYTEGSCSVTWGKLKRKLKTLADANAEAAGAAPATPKSTAGRKRKGKEAEVEESPTKKSRSVKGAAKTDSAAEEKTSAKSTQDDE